MLEFVLMITNIPNTTDFIKAGKAHLDFAWEIAISFLKLIDEASQWDAKFEDEATEEEFWEATNTKLNSALAMVQQAVELILKGRILDVSPFLIIDGNIADYKTSPDFNSNFFDFRTIEAQELIKTHNLVCSENSKLDANFIIIFNSLRNFRNSVLHTANATVKTSALEVISKVLEINNFLFPNERWVDTRKHFLENSPETFLHGSDHIHSILSWEFYIVYSNLTPSEIKKYFKVDKKSSRNYFCPLCYSESQDAGYSEGNYAILKPNSPTSTNLYCFVCNENHLVKRINCNDSGCKGNVISEEYLICCTCGSYQ